MIFNGVNIYYSNKTIYNHRKYQKQENGNNERIPNKKSYLKNYF